jgi:YD repeat-containing protein
MSKSDIVEISYHFENYKPPARRPLEEFAESVQYIVQEFPSVISCMPFGIASRVCAGNLNAFPDVVPPIKKDMETGKKIRLKAIMYAGSTLILHSYDADGRLLKTDYPDGRSVWYLWDAYNRPKELRLSQNDRILVQFMNGFPDAIQYPGNETFRYKHDKNGNMLSCDYPDRRSIRLSSDMQCGLTEAAYGESHFRYEYDSQRRLQKVTFQYGAKSYVFEQSEKAFQTNPIKLDYSGNSSQIASSALGLWKYGQDGRLLEIFTPSGERLCFFSQKDMDIHWSILGKTVYEYDEFGALASFTHPNGTRSVFFRVPDTRNVLLVNIGGVLLYQYDRYGRLIKIREDDGQYTIFSYNERNSVIKATFSEGEVQFIYDGEERLCKIVSVKDRWIAIISYANGNFPSTARIDTAQADPLGSVIAFDAAIWQWTALRRVLRLEDKALKE